MVRLADTLFFVPVSFYSDSDPMFILLAIAPTDSAFDGIVPPEGNDLTDLLSYHVSPEVVVVDPGQEDEFEVATLLLDANVTITTTMSSDAASVNGVPVLATVEASNGRVFILDEVLVPIVDTNN